MSHATWLRNGMTTQDWRMARLALFKRDRPRAVDQYINYFGDPVGEGRRFSGDVPGLAAPWRSPTGAPETGDW